MDHHLRKRFCSAEDELLDALCEGESHISSYNSRWTSLNSDFTAAICEGKVSQQTMDIALSVASRITSIAESFAKFTSDQQSSTSAMYADIQRILDGISSIDVSELHTFPPTPRSSCERELQSGLLHPDSHIPAYIAPAYEWLLKNLHNPYPSGSVKSEIAHTCECSLASINAWFNTVRRRMGWTKLCREHFHNCRADMVDAAYRALVVEDPSQGLDPNLIHAFMVMKVTAEDLYSSTLTKSALAGDLDAVVKEMTKDDRKVAEEEKRREVKEYKILKQREKGERRRQRALEREIRKTITPANSPTGLPPSPPAPLDDLSTDETTGGEDVLPPIVAGHKRRLGKEPDHSPAVQDRPVKRLRSDVETEATAEEPPACLLSPLLTESSIGESSDDGPSKTLFSLLPTPPTTSRKRRLSDAGFSSMSKRPRASLAGPRPQAVSDPLPRCAATTVSEVDDWFNENFDSLFSLPPPVDFVAPDCSSPWEVKLFNNYSILHKPAPQSTSSGFKDSPAAERALTPVAGLVEFDHIFQSIENNSVGTVPDPVKMASVQIPCIDSIPSYSTTLSSDQLRSLDWSSLLNDAEDLTAAADTIIPQSCGSPKVTAQPLPEIDLYMLQPPRAVSHISQPPVLEDPTSKQAKLSQLQAMQEAVRRMEKEIFEDGLSCEMLPLFC